MQDGEYCRSETGFPKIEKKSYWYYELGCSKAWDKSNIYSEYLKVRAARACYLQVVFSLGI